MTDIQKQAQVLDAIEQNGTPLYIYDLDQVRQNFRHLQKAISYQPKRIYYAMMANPDLGILETMQKLGAGVQVNTLDELDCVLQIFDREDKISFTSTGLSKQMLEAITSYESQVNLDSVEEVNKLLRFPPCSFGVRLQMPQVCFNGTYDRTENSTGIIEQDLELVRLNARNHGSRINGIHGYCGSNIFDPEFLKQSADYILRCARDFPDLEYVNFGGGFGVPVNPSQKPLNLEEVLGYYSGLVTKLSEDLGKEIELRIEPGRALVANAGTLYTRVTNVKQLNRADGKLQVSVDCGFGEFARPRLYGTYHEIFAFGKEGNTMYCDVRANTVLQDDYLAKNVRLPEIKEGAILGIKNVGAYGAVMASGFPGKGFPAEVCI